jgi:hypothetical protein
MSFSSVLAELGAGYSFNSKNSSGAVLALPMGAASSQFYAIKELRQWIVSKHVDRWFNFVEKQGEEPHTLSVVTGVYHAKSWALSAYSNTSKSSNISMKLKISPVGSDVGASGTYSLSWESNSSDPGRICPPEQCSPHALWNQAVFITCLHIHKHGRASNNPFAKMFGRLTAKFRKPKPDTGDGHGSDSYKDAGSGFKSTNGGGGNSGTLSKSSRNIGTSDNIEASSITLEETKGINKKSETLVNHQRGPTVDDQCLPAGLDIYSLVGH